MTVYDIWQQSVDLWEKELSAPGVLAAIVGRLPIGEAHLLGPAPPAVLQFLQTRATDEAPTLTWIAAALLADASGTTFDSFLRIRYLKALNYIGAHQRVLELTSTEGLTHRRELKQRAKALKSLGDFDAARDVYRTLLAHATDKREIAYYLLLFAKLCHDFQQRRGWHRAYHEISYRRLSGSDFSPDRPLARRRWQISADSFAAVLYLEDPEGAEDIFSQIVSDWYRCDDIALRVRAHRLRGRHELALGVGTSDEVVDALSGFGDVVRCAHITGNVRAICARTVQYCEMVRQSRERFGDAVMDAAGIPTLNEVHPDLRLVASLASRMGDRKSLALANYEIAKRLGYAREGYEEAGAALQSALDAATGIANELARIYQRVLSSLARLHEVHGDLDSAQQATERALEYALDLQKSLVSDEDELLAAMRIVRSERLAAVPTPEFRLSLPEFEVLQAGLRIDYRELLHRTTSLSARVHDLQLRQMANIVRQSRELHLEFRFHALSGHLRRMRGALHGDRLSPDRMPEDLETHITQFEEELRGWRRDERDSVARTVIDLGEALANAVASDAIQRTPAVIEWEPPPRPVRAEFHRSVLRHIIKILVENSAEAAERQGMKTTRVRLALSEARDAVVLIYSDDAGEVETLRAAVVDVNSGRRPQSARDPGRRGQGLSLVKGYAESFGGVHEWEVADAAPPFTKTLRIPLAMT